jgi:hypothetical protein
MRSWRERERMDVVALDAVAAARKMAVREMADWYAPQALGGPQMKA